MHTVFGLSSSRSRRPAVILLTAVAIVVSVPSAGALDPEPQPVLRVEEDWRLVLNEPDDAVYAPQFHTTMSPVRHLDSFYTQATWNWRELPEFSPGGLQIQVWDGDNFLFEKSSGSNKLSTVAETITWTQVLKTNGTNVSFKIADGRSTTWGSFGGSNMRVAGGAYLPNLNGYSTDVSAENSWITYGANRVDLLVITEVRRYGPGGLMSVDSTPRVVFQQRE